MSETIQQTAFDVERFYWTLAKLINRDSKRDAGKVLMASLAPEHRAQLWEFHNTVRQIYTGCQGSRIGDFVKSLIRENNLNNLANIPSRGEETYKSVIKNPGKIADHLITMLLTGDDFENWMRIFDSGNKESWDSNGNHTDSVDSNESTTDDGISILGDGDDNLTDDGLSPPSGDNYYNPMHDGIRGYGSEDSDDDLTDDGLSPPSGHNYYNPMQDGISGYGRVDSDDNTMDDKFPRYPSVHNYPNTDDGIYRLF